MKRKILLVALMVFYVSAFCQESATVLNAQGIALAKNGEIEKAFALFERAIVIDPNFSDGYSNRGNVYRMQKKYALALEDYSKSIALNPNLDVIYARANTYSDAGDWQNTIKDYSTIISRKPSFPSIYFDRAYAYIMMDNYNEAKNDLELQLQLDPTDFKSLANLIGVKKKLKRYDEALADYETILKQFPNQPDLEKIYNNRAGLYFEINQFEKALADANKAIEINNSYDLGHLMRGEIYMKLGNNKKACKDLQEALQLGIEKNPYFETDKDFEDLKKLCN